MEKIIKLITNIDNNDESIATLEEAMNFFCSTWDKCEGYKHALIACIEDQYQHHVSEQDPKDLVKLEAILTK